MKTYLDGKYISQGDARKIIGVAPSTIYEWGRSGCLDGIRVRLGSKWLVPVEWVEEVKKNGFSGSSSRTDRRN